MKSSQGVCLIVGNMICFVLMITTSMGNDRSVSEEVCRSPSALLSPMFFYAGGCGMLVGSFLLSVFFFPFLPYSISCVFTVLFPYTSGIFLYMCDYWSCIIGWVCLTKARVLCSPSDLYMPVHPMCNNHCIAFDVSPPLWLSLRLAFFFFGQSLAFCKSTSCDNIKNELSYFINS